MEIKFKSLECADSAAKAQEDLLLERYPELQVLREEIWQVYKLLRSSYEKGGKLLIAGNGGSKADSDHIVGELMKGFCKKRPIDARLKKALEELGEPELTEELQTGLPAISLGSHTALGTAFANDVNPACAFAQELMGYAKPEDVFLGISTSGNSKNILYAVKVAKALGIPVIGLTGRDGGALGKLADIPIIVPVKETYQIQELHLPIYHTLCLMLEDSFFEC